MADDATPDEGRGNDMEMLTCACGRPSVHESGECEACAGRPEHDQPTLIMGGAMKRCEECGALVADTWPVAVNGDTDDIRNLCNGCAATDPDSAAVLDMLKRDEE